MSDDALPAWFVYLLECRGGRVYTGIATDVDRRLAEHVAGKGARFTRAHPPVRELARFPCADRPSALRREAAIKRLPAAQKRLLAASATHVPVAIPATAEPAPTIGGVASPAAAVETVTVLGKLETPP
jgi:putative endonuclease